MGICDGQTGLNNKMIEFQGAPLESQSGLSLFLPSNCQDNPWNWQVSQSRSSQGKDGNGDIQGQRSFNREERDSQTSSKTVRLVEHLSRDSESPSVQIQVWHVIISPISLHIYMSRIN